MKVLIAAVIGAVALASACKSDRDRAVDRAARCDQTCLDSRQLDPNFDFLRCHAVCNHSLAKEWEETQKPPTEADRRRAAEWRDAVAKGLLACDEGCGRYSDNRAGQTRCRDECKAKYRECMARAEWSRAGDCEDWTRLR